MLSNCTQGAIYIQFHAFPNIFRAYGMHLFEETELCPHPSSYLVIESPMATPGRGAWCPPGKGAPMEEPDEGQILISASARIT